jgi:hypothetical protein
MTAIAATATTTAVISAIAITGEVKNGEDIFFIRLGSKMNSLSEQNKASCRTSLTPRL